MEKLFRLRAPALSTAISLLALSIVLGGTAVAVAPTVINIADPTTPANKAHVDASGKLEVGDGQNALTVDGTVNTQLAPPNTVRHLYENLNGGGSCTQIATPLSGKAMIVDQIRVNVFGNPSPGSGQYVGIFTGANCETFVGDVNPPTVGLFVIPFTDGLGIPAGSAVSVLVGGSLQTEIFLDTHTVGSAVVPAAAGGTSANQAPQQQR